MLDRIAALERIVAEDPSDTRARLKLGDAYRDAHRPDDALVQYLAAARDYAARDYGLKALAIFKVCLGMGADVQAEAREQARKLGLGDDAVEPLVVTPRGHLN